MEQFFPEYGVSLFHESNFGHPLLNGHCIYFGRALTDMNCLYEMYLTDISFLGIL